MKYFKEYLSAIIFAAVLVIAFLLAQLPFSLWLPGYTFLPEWLHDRSILLLAASYFIYILIPAILFGTPIFYFRVLKKI